jgi:hypothetical protein
MFKFASEDVDFDISETFEQMVGLLRKVEIWWFKNLEAGSRYFCESLFWASQPKQAAKT